ncbi:MAG: STELLO glycosyltransferase family protein [Desulfobacteraceae bacterium]|nr:STELLO glycosyltransferase family protein [Desulfobacteraceae bacterium]
MNCIVITSVNDPTEAIRSFSKLKNYRLIVVGDKKTPSNWSCEDAIFLSIEKQLQIGRHLNKILPFNHYCRKMMGYLYAFEMNAQCIVDTDDDNIPKHEFSFPAFEGEYNMIEKDQGFINIYQYFTDQKIWPRGLPLKNINKDYEYSNNLTNTKCKVGVWQGLADKDPDVDAIYRLIDNRPCSFKEREPIVLSKGTLSPFNTQNTLIRKELFPLLYLPAHVTFRFTDILRSLVAQPIMWLHGYNLGFIGATVTQKRNPHDYFEDFISEIPMYQNTEQVVEIVMKTIKKRFSMSENLFLAYEALLDAGIVKNNEIDVLTAWLKDIERYKS